MSPDDPTPCAGGIVDAIDELLLDQQFARTTASSHLFVVKRLLLIHLEERQFLSTSDTMALLEAIEDALQRTLDEVDGEEFPNATAELNDASNRVADVRTGYRSSDTNPWTARFDETLERQLDDERWGLDFSRWTGEAEIDEQLETPDD